MNTVLALGYLGVSWGDTNAESNSQDQGTEASFLPRQLCSPITTGAEITLRPGTVGLISPKHLHVSSPCGYDSCVPRTSSEPQVPVCCRVPHLGSEVMKHLFCHTLLVTSEPCTREVSLLLEGGMIFYGEACGPKLME